MTQKLKISMLEAEIAQLKAELFVQTEIANNNKDAYNELKVRYDKVNNRLVDCMDDIVKLSVEFENKQKRIIGLVDFKQSQDNELLLKSDSAKQSKLDRIPNWVRWIFKYIF